MKDCNACGKCCTKYGGSDLTVSQHEISAWQEEAPNISAYVHQDQIWFDPKSKQPLANCPWLQPMANATGYLCAIYAHRPDDCRYYPSNLDEMIRDDCEMLEAKDKQNPKQAQKALELIMKDSWVST